MKLLAILLLLATPIDPTFERSPKGWLPHCPAGTDLVRHRPAPDCVWGTAPMSQKPTQGDMECMPLGMIPSDMPACPAE